MKILWIFLFVIFVPLASSAHYIVGYVEDSFDGNQIANGRIVYIWNFSNPQNNITDIVGPSGNSGVDNIYMIDCEVISCQVGDILSVGIIDDGSGYFSDIVNVTVTGFGYTQASNLTLNSPPQIMSTEITDLDKIFLTEINLLPKQTKPIHCRAIVTELDGESQLRNASAVFFDTVNSNLFSADNNNDHYTDPNCYINESYGSASEVEILCNFSVWYYANYGDWLCNISVSDNLSISAYNYTTSTINELLAIELVDTIEFLNFNQDLITDESVIDVTNYGNTKINLSLSGYGSSVGDGYSMTCLQGNIPVDSQKFNLTSSNSGDINAEQYSLLYSNLTVEPKIYEFNLDYRTNPVFNDALKSTYWRIQIPREIKGPCSGNLLFGAIQAEAST